MMDLIFNNQEYLFYLIAVMIIGGIIRDHYYLADIFGLILRKIKSKRLLLSLVSLFGGVTSQSGPRKPVSIVGGLFSVVFGLILLLLPAPTLAIMTILIATLFLLSGVAEIASSFSIRSLGGNDNHWGLAFFSGLVGVVLGVLLLGMWPDSFEVIGLLLGLNFLLSGAYLISLGWFFRHAPAY